MFSWGLLPWRDRFSSRRSVEGNELGMRPKESTGMSTVARIQRFNRPFLACDTLVITVDRHLSAKGLKF